MINSKKELDFYLLQDARANGRSSTKARFWGDEIWKYQRSLVLYKQRVLDSENILAV